MQRIGRYEVIDELGRGAMGVVYRARDTQIGRIVALKVILTANASEQDIERYKQRFRREAQAAGRLSHPGIVTIHDIAEDETGQPYLVMEYIEGRPLNLLLGPTAQVPLDRLLDIAIQVAEALDYAHRAGIVHRDIKPPNILVTPDGKAKIADFGIARMEGTELTQEGTSVGTPSYMSPEQFRGGEIDGRSDLFSLGAVIYWMITGEKPFPGETVTRISFQVAFEAPTPASVTRPGLPKDLDEILSRCMAKEPAGRYFSGAELAADLAAVRTGKPLPERGALPRERTAAFPLPARDAGRGSADVEASDPDAKTRVGVAATGSRTQPLAPPARRRFPPGFVLLFAAIAAAGLGWGYWKFVRAPAGIPSPAPDATRPASVPATAGGNSPPAAASSAGDGGAGKKSIPASGQAPDATGDAKSVAAPVSPAAARAGAAGNPSAAPGTAGAPAAGAAGAPAGGNTAERTENPAADATLEIICKYPFKQATLEIFVDANLIFRGTLEAKRQALTLGMTRGGRLEAKRRIPSGRRAIRVLVKSEEEKYEDETTLTESISPHAVRTLEITFGREGSGPSGGRKVHLDLY